MREPIHQVRVASIPAEPPAMEDFPRVLLPRPSLLPWLRAVTIGELLGFTATAGIAFLALSLFGRPETVHGRIIALLVMVLAGTLEGASIGFFEWRALRRWLPDLSARRFTGATIAVAATGWLIGMSVPLAMTLTHTHVAGWALGLPFSYLAGSVGSEGMAWWQALGLSAAAAACMGLCVAVTTFIATRRMEPISSASSPGSQTALH